MSYARKINKISTRRAAALKAYSRLKSAWLADPANKKCRVANCARPTTDLHHQYGRVAGLLTDTRYWIPLCKVHHHRVHTDIPWARENNLIAKKGEWLNPPK